LCDDARRADGLTPRRHDGERRTRLRRDRYRIDLRHARRVEPRDEDFEVSDAEVIGPRARRRGSVRRGLDGLGRRRGELQRESRQVLAAPVERRKID
jgi:hypothetical protein